VSDRIPCINPRCRRTAPRRTAAVTEIVCGKCWRAFVPASVRLRYRDVRRAWRTQERRIVRRGDTLSAASADQLRRRLMARVDANWQEIRAALLRPERPEGLDGFLQEVGLA